MERSVSFAPQPLVARVHRGNPITERSMLLTEKSDYLIRKINTSSN